jgi:pimeloyl-ACP methyl ester carboxylesterase
VPLRGLAVLAVASLTAGEAAAQAPLSPCSVPRVASEARCGTIEVWENRTTKTGRRIALNVIVLPAKGGERRPDPLVALQGGPGDAPSFNASFYARAFSTVHETRDLVFIDLRGTGKSAPLLCPELATPASTGLLDDHLLSAPALTACRARLEQTADLRQYTTDIAVDDLAEALEGLGYGQVNLYGTSYGTRAALAFMRRHPARVRTATLKGVVPASMTMPATHSRASETAWRALVARCTADAACARAYPTLAADLAAILKRLERALVIDVPASAARPASRLTVTRGLFAEAFRNSLYSPEGIAALPALISRLRSDDRALGEMALATRLLMSGERLAAGFFLSVTCAEDVPFLPTKLGPLVEGTFAGDYRLREQIDACAVWPQGPRPTARTRVLRSTIPTLLLSGALDPVTPPSGGEEVVSGLARGRHVVIANNGHAIGKAERCIGSMMTAFIDRASAADIDASCAATVPVLPFSLPDR